MLSPVKSLLQSSLFAVACVAITLGGCSSGGLVSVDGKVVCDGQPLKMGSVRFVPDTTKGNSTGQEPVGQIGSDGKYSLMTGDSRGAAPGWYKVSVVSMEMPDSAKPLATKSYVAERFSDPQKSGLSVEVKSSAAAGAYDLTVTAK